MKISLTVSLPRDASSVPVVRAVAAQILVTAGFDGDDVADLGLALTEACSNVLRHSVVGDDYEVLLWLNGASAVLEVRDNGLGFNATDLGLSQAPPLAEEGRGIQLMRALMDELEFVSRPGGSAVRMDKRLRPRPTPVLT